MAAGLKQMPDGFHRVEASSLLGRPPKWAILERSLFALLERAASRYLARYTNEDGSLTFRERPLGRDGVDDFYESFYHLPLLYLLGGGQDLLVRAHHHWEGVTQQLTRLGSLEDEFEKGFDWFHQGEGQLFFYNLCLADPENGLLQERASRFARFYTRSDGDAPNYDSARNIIRAPHNGSGGPRWGYFDDVVAYPWSDVVAPDLAPYGLPYSDVAGVSSFSDLAAPELARRMGQTMEHRMGRGDVAVNLATVALAANAFLLTGDLEFRDWALRYTGGWEARAEANGGLIPDTVGLDGDVGAYVGGRWYGGLYGWTWPHGLYSVGAAATIAAMAAVVLSGDRSHLELARAPLDRVTAQGTYRRFASEQSTLRDLIGPQVAAAKTDATFVVPYRFGDEGWFDFHPMPMSLLTAIWTASLAVEDARRIDDLREIERTNWETVIAFRSKEDNGHERPWYSYLKGEYDTYPEEILMMSHQSVYDRLQAIANDDADLRSVDTGSWQDVHHWQMRNPLTVEALLQLTLGAPAPLYNGGLLNASVRYFDYSALRPGLPPDVGALVTELKESRVSLELVNLATEERRDVLVQAGGFAEHEFVSVTRGRDHAKIQISDRWLHVVLPPSSEVELSFEWRRFKHPPTARLPWSIVGTGDKD